MHKRDIPMLLTAEEIQDRIETLAHEIVASSPKELVLVSLLKGGFIFTADLMRELSNHDLQLQVDFMTVSSYGDGMESTGTVTVVQDATTDINGKNVLIVDDILESGRTLHHTKELLKNRGAASVRLAVLLEKPGKRDMAFTADFVGFTIPDRFVVGYGLDYAGHYRELPYIGVIDIH